MLSWDPKYCTAHWLLHVRGDRRQENDKEKSTMLAKTNNLGMRPLIDWLFLSNELNLVPKLFPMHYRYHTISWSYVGLMLTVTPFPLFPLHLPPRKLVYLPSCSPISHLRKEWDMTLCIVWFAWDKVSNLGVWLLGNQLFFSASKRGMSSLASLPMLSVSKSSTLAVSTFTTPSPSSP